MDTTRKVFNLFNLTHKLIRFNDDADIRLQYSITVVSLFAFCGFIKLIYSLTANDAYVKYICLN